MKEKKINGRVWLIKDQSGKLIDNIDTDQIFHNRHLHITDIKEMGQFAFGNLKGWEDFPSKAREGDLIIVGRNFGSGSSRQQAVDCFKTLGIRAVIAKSFGAIYKRNAINSALPLIQCDGIEDAGLDNGQTIELDLESGKITDKNGEALCTAKPMTDVQMDIYRAGGLFEYAKKVIGD